MALLRPSCCRLMAAYKRMGRCSNAVQINGLAVTANSSLVQSAIAPLYIRRALTPVYEGTLGTNIQCRLRRAHRLRRQNSNPKSDLRARPSWGRAAAHLRQTPPPTPHCLPESRGTRMWRAAGRCSRRLRSRQRSSASKPPANGATCTASHENCRQISYGSACRLSQIRSEAAITPTIKRVSCQPVDSSITCRQA